MSSLLALACIAASASIGRRDRNGAILVLVLTFRTYSDSERKLDENRMHLKIKDLPRKSPRELSALLIIESPIPDRKTIPSSSIWNGNRMAAWLRSGHGETVQVRESRHLRSSGPFQGLWRCPNRASLVADGSDQHPCHTQPQATPVST